jgi:hypothetical protein
MKRLFRVLLILSVMLPVLVAPVSAAKPTKETVCHNGHTISVSAKAAAFHLANHANDYAGACAL